MRGVGQVVRAGVQRHRVQTAVMTLTTLVAVAASILAGGLLVTAQGPFEHAFNQQHGSQLTVQFDAARASVTQVGATRRLPTVAVAAGPFADVTITPTSTRGTPGVPPDAQLAPMVIVGRSNPAGPVDDVQLTDGRWATGPGQIVVSEASLPGTATVGSTLRFPSAAGDPTLTIVGVARSMSQTADGWVTPAQEQALHPDAYQMLYRFSHASSSAQMAADRASIAGTVPVGAVNGSQSWLSLRQQSDAKTEAFVPFLTAFGILALVLSILTIGLVISGSVTTGRRRIGILKSLGFTPVQIARAYVVQAVASAALGATIGVVLGNMLAIPVLGHAGHVYGTGPLTVPLWVDLAVPAVALLAVALAALVPAWRAGNMRAIEAIALGRSPRARRGQKVNRWAGRLPLPRALTLGLAGPFARPGRSASMAAAVALGATAVTFAVGLGFSLERVQTERDLSSAGAVVVRSWGTAGPEAGPAGAASAVRIIASEHGTRSYYGTSFAQLAVYGLTGSTNVIGYEGDSSWATHPMISGTWLTGPGQIVVSPRFLTATNSHVGDYVTLSTGTASAMERIVGQVFELSDDGMDVLTSSATLGSLGVSSQPDQYNIQLRPGTSTGTYLSDLNRKLAPTGLSAAANQTTNSSVIGAMEAVVAMLTLMLLVAAALGVLNTVVLDTSERVHDLGVYKAIGMTPRQTIASILASVVGIGLLAGIVGVPLGVGLHHYIMPVMAHTIGEQIPPSDVSVYAWPMLLALGAGGLVIAMAGALLPAGWAAGSRTAVALRTE